MRLVLGSRSFDLDTQAVVVGMDDASGADLVEGAPGGFAMAKEEYELEAALSTGACLVRLAAPTPSSLRRCAAAGVAVVVAGAAASGMPPDRVVDDRLFLDVAGQPCSLPAVAAGVVGGARVIRTTDARTARRVADVIAAILEVDR